MDRRRIESRGPMRGRWDLAPCGFVRALTVVVPVFAISPFPLVVAFRNVISGGFYVELQLKLSCEPTTLKIKPQVAPRRSFSKNFFGAFIRKNTGLRKKIAKKRSFKWICLDARLETAYNRYRREARYASLDNTPAPTRGPSLESALSATDMLR